MLEEKRLAGDKPDYFLLTAEEWIALKRSASAASPLGCRREGVADEIHGMPVVIEGSKQHRNCQGRGLRGLRPNT